MRGAVAVAPDHGGVRGEAVVDLARAHRLQDARMSDKGNDKLVKGDEEFNELASKIDELDHVVNENKDMKKSNT